MSNPKDAKSIDASSKGLKGKRVLSDHIDWRLD